MDGIMATSRQQQIEALRQAIRDREQAERRRRWSRQRVHAQMVRIVERAQRDWMASRGK